MTVTDQIKILNRKIMQNKAQYEFGRKAAKISALSSNNLDKYEYLTGETLGYKPSVIEQAKSEYYPLGKVFTKGLDDKDDEKEGLLKRLKNIGKNQNRNNNNKNKKTNDIIKSRSIRSESSSGRSESSKKTSISVDELDRSVYLPDVAKMQSINILEPKNKTQTCFEYLKNNIEEFFLGCPYIFDSDLKNIFKGIASEEEENFD